jgi:hypothetical protein
LEAPIVIDVQSTDHRNMIHAALGVSQSVRTVCDQAGPALW